MYTCLLQGLGSEVSRREENLVIATTNRDWDTIHIVT